MDTESAHGEMKESELEYVGFWARVGAAIVDTICLMLISVPVMIALSDGSTWRGEYMVEGPAALLLDWILPAIAILLFWYVKQATPGKMLISARIVDAETGAKPSGGQLIGRYLGYFVSMLPLFLGILWVGFDRKKQGWHDKLAGTVVVRPRNRGTDPVAFRRS